MEKKSIAKDFLLFIALAILFAALYYLFNKEEINKTNNYEFVIYSILGASSVIFVPLIQKLFRKKQG